MRFESWMTCEKYVDDGNWTIGYVDGKPTQWDGNTELVEGEEFSPASEGDTFGVNCQDEFIVREGIWRINESSHGGYRPGSGRKLTGRKKRVLYITDNEFAKIKKLIVELRSAE